MEKERLESLLIDYIDGKLSAEETATVERMIADDAATRKLYEEFREVMQVMDHSAKLEPSSKLKTKFDKLLNEEIRETKATKTIFFAPVFYRAAAGIALVMVGIAIGYWINKNQQHQQELADLKKQMEEMKSMMIAKLENPQSASQRMIAVAEVVKMEKPDDEIVKALVKTLNEDGNTNVRLAALDALSRFQTEPQVRKELVKSLSKQNDPVVQIALIQLMVKMKEKGVVNDLQHIIDDEKSLKAVKDEAYSGILKLS